MNAIEKRAIEGVLNADNNDEAVKALKAYANQQVGQHSKDDVVAILEKRAKDAFSNEWHNFENNVLYIAIKTINDLVPPYCFESKQQGEVPTDEEIEKAEQLLKNH